MGSYGSVTYLTLYFSTLLSTFRQGMRVKGPYGAIVVFVQDLMKHYIAVL